MTTICEKDKCVGCLACVSSCPVEAVRYEETMGECNAYITDNCIGCNMCKSRCQIVNPPSFRTPIKCFQGWNSDVNVRIKCTSGGVATGIAKSFILNGGKAVLCGFMNNTLGYCLVDKPEAVPSFSGSKYIKASMKGVHQLVLNQIKEGFRVLFIGLPCHVASLYKSLSKSEQRLLYTIDLICHGSPSMEMFNLFMEEYPEKFASVKDMNHLRFRDGYNYRISIGNEPLIHRKVLDKYTLAFINSISFTENCYECQYAKLDRVSDLTLGDSWGTELPLDEVTKGVSLILCQSEKGMQLLSETAVELKPVDMSIAQAYNHQLVRASARPPKRSRFMSMLRKGKSFNRSLYSSLFVSCIKQDIKQALFCRRR